MMKKFFFIITVSVLIFINNHSKSEIFIVANINNKILTNFDLEREASYLKILNPQLTQLEEKKLFTIAKNSLIKETIKKKELKKYFIFEKELNVIDEILKDFIINLRIENTTEFEEILKKNKTYTIPEIKEKMKVEFFWNKLILEKYSKIKNVKGIKTEYLLSEIFFNKKNDLSLDNQVKRIKKSINEIGFNNTASMYSQSESSNMGGKIGWVEEESLSQKIIKELKKIKVNGYTNVIQFGNNFLILKIEDKKIKKIKINEDLMLKNMINFEKNKQLNQFSNIYYNKVKINYTIDEN